MDTRASFSALQVVQTALRSHIREGDLCVDATAGRGRDTLFLANLVGETGRVLAFDIQKEAIDSTASLLTQHGLRERVVCLQESHSRMEDYALPGTVSCVTFNFGWLPGGDHHIFTQAKTSLPAIEAGLRLLREDGMMSLILYYGRETGYAERDALLAYLPTIDSRRFTVIEMPFVNRQNCPPIPVLIFKGR